MDIVKPKDVVTNNIKMLIYGSSGIGKTRFSTDFLDSEKTLLIDLEKGSASVKNKNIDSVRINTAGEYKQVLKELQSDTKYDNIIVDSYTKYSEMVYDVLKTLDPSRKNGQAVWGEYDFHMKSNTLSLLALNKNIIINCIDDLVLFEDYRISFPLVLGQKFKVGLPKEFDVIGFLTQDKENNRILKLERTNEFLAKDRFGFLPSEIRSDNELYGAEKLINYIKTKIKGD